MQEIFYYIHFITYSFLSYFFLRFLKFLYKNFIRKRLNLLKRYGNNSWVLVTGASDGIGKSFCEEFASEGFNIILVSRTLSKLQSVESELKSKFPSIQTHVIEFDFDKLTKLQDYKNYFKNVLENFDVSILVNNVGINHVSLPFEYYDLEDVYKFININVIPQAVLTKLFVEKLSKRSSRSGIINLSSYATFGALPYNAMYCATKSYNDVLSRALSYEYQLKNVDFLSVKPLFAETPLSKMKANGFSVITAKQSVRGIVNDLGHENYTEGHWIHKIQAFFLNMIPKSLVYFSLVKFKRFVKIKN
jgi:17beta-estradiol 17-dehydrogenase / very-long-chain 3-oxoacyl-CoA reductase